MEKAKYDSIASNLFDGGWRAKDRQQLKDEYGLNENELDEIVTRLEEYEDEKE